MSAKQSYIFRAPKDKENPYAQIRRDTLRDRSLSWAARGMLAYLLSQADSWKVVINDLEQNCGRDVVYNLLNELKEHGYIERVSERNDKGHVLSWNYAVHEQPLLTEKTEVGIEQKTLLTENPTLGIPYLRDFSTHKNNELESFKNKQENPAPAVQPSVTPKSKPKTKPKESPTVKPTEKKAATSRKKLTRLEQSKANMQPYREIVHQMALVCKLGYDMMGDVDHSLSVPELEDYTLYASEYVRLGGKVEDIKAIYAWIDENTADRNWSIAPKSIVKALSGWKSEQQQQPAPIVRSAAISPIGRNVSSAADRMAAAAQLRADREKVFGKRSTQELKQVG